VIKNYVPVKKIKMGGCFMSTGYKYMRVEGENNDPSVLTVARLRDGYLLTFGNNDRVLPICSKN